MEHFITNYLSCKLQFNTLFIGYDLIGFIDGSKPCPLPTIIATINSQITNPIFTQCKRQDQLILNTLIGSISPTIIPFVASATTCCEAWNILVNTYAKPSRGHHLQIKIHLKNPHKGSRSVTKYLQWFKCHVYELALLGAPIDAIKLIEQKILDGLNDEFHAK